MSTTSFVILVVLVWLSLGLGAVVLFLGRRGYRDRNWYLLGAVLGPLFVPIAMDRGRRAGHVVERTFPTGVDPAGRLTIVVGVDGSTESDRAVRDAAHLFGPARARVVLAAVVDPDVAEFGDGAELQVWHDLLVERASWFPAGTPAPVREVLCGQPARMLLRAAEAEQADAVLVGRRGRGLSHRLLGSVAESLTRHASCPVLLAGPVTRATRATASTLPWSSARRGHRRPTRRP